ncbi:hypothetical protein L7F22_008908 [Adiantum nelumboides]|nr:hypothetical protein [Adiantum nelumboides]
MRSLAKEEEEGAIGSTRDHGSSSVDSSPNCESCMMALSCDVEGNARIIAGRGPSSECGVVEGKHASSNDGNEQQESSLYGYGPYRDKQRLERRHLSWLNSAKLAVLKQRRLQRAKSSRKHDSCSSPAASSLTCETPRPSSACSASSRSPLKLASMHSPSSPAMIKVSSPLLLSGGLIPRPQLPCSKLSNSPLQLLSSITSLPGPAPSSLRLPSARPTIASLASSKAHLALSAEEPNPKSGQRVISGAAGVRRKRKVRWLSFVLRKLRILRLKRRVHERKELAEGEVVDWAESDSNRASSANESDYLRHSHSTYNNNVSGSVCSRGRHSRTSSNNSDLQSSSLGLLQSSEQDSKSLGAFANYHVSSSPALMSSLGGLQARHRYKSMSYVQRRESTAELLKFYLPPPSFYSNVYGSSYH